MGSASWRLKRCHRYYRRFAAARLATQQISWRRAVTARAAISDQRAKKFVPIREIRV
jgi:hypothetical protein